jgi:hypothetical protein
MTSFSASQFASRFSQLQTVRGDTVAQGGELRPKMLKGGLVQFAQSPPGVLNVIAFQYNPDTLTRTLTPRAMGGEPGDRLETLRLTGPPKETIKVEAEFDAADTQPQYVATPYLETVTQAVGLLPTLAALEGLISPTSAQIGETSALFGQGKFEVAPVEAPLTLFVWGSKRIVPVLVTSMTLTEEAFGAQLQPIRAKVSLDLKILTSSDFPPGSNGEARYLAYRSYNEAWAAQVATTNTATLGIEHLS